MAAKKAMHSTRPTPAQVMAAKRAEFPGTEVGYDGQNFTGSNWDLERDITEIAKLVRADIKALIANGDLPKLTALVRTRRYSGGQSLTVRVTELDIGAKVVASKVVPAYTKDEFPFIRMHGKPIKLAAVKALARINLLLSSYNYDHGDSQTDYYCVNFHQEVELDPEILRQPAPPKEPKPVVVKTRWDLIG